MGTIAVLVTAAALVAFWLQQWHSDQRAAGEMSNRAIVLWSLGLSLPVQYCWVLASIMFELVTTGISHGEGGGHFGCPNLHESGLWTCSFGQMLLSPLSAVLLVNFLSFGIVFLVTAAIIGGVLMGWRLWRRRRAALT